MRLESASDSYAQVTAPPPVERVLHQWQQIVEAHGRMVIDDLGADRALYQALRDAYRHALAALIGSAARLGRRPAAVLYDQLFLPRGPEEPGSGAVQPVAGRGAKREHAV